LAKVEWSLEATPSAEEDLTYLKRHARNVRQEVRSRVLPTLFANPEVGEELERECEGTRAVHFGKNDDYRLAYELVRSDPEHGIIRVLAVGLKKGFYETLAERLRYIRKDAKEAPQRDSGQ
jgi:mRNA-degrading endonuclease RelE of RelBE toxin-antitoxin system